MMITPARGLLSCLFALCIGLLSTTGVSAAVITVTSDADTSSDTECILRDAINSVNLAALQGGCTNSGGSFADNDRVEFALGLPFTISLTNGALLITQPITISSGSGGISGAELATIQHPLGGLANPGRVFHVDGVRASISNFTIRGGYMAHANYPDDHEMGGGIYATNGAELRLTTSIVRDNRADIGGGVGLDATSNVTVSNSRIISNTAVAGGGIGAIDQSGVYLLGSTVVELNRADELGGGIGVRDNSLVRVSGAIVTNNSAYAVAEDYAGMGLVIPPITEGGGIFGSNNSRVELIRGGIVSNNTARLGGGIRLLESELDATDSQITNNSSEGITRIFNDNVTVRQGFGGGIHADDSSVNIENTTVSMNSAGSGGGMFASDGADFGVIRSTFSGNTAQHWGGAAYLSGSTNGGFVNSTVSGNTAGLNPEFGVFPGGGGVYAFGAGSLQFIHTTLAENLAQSGTGGGIYMNDTNVVLWNSLLAGNSASVGGEFTDADGSLAFNSSGNLFGDASKTFDEAMEFPFFLLFPSAGDVITSSTLRSGEANSAARPLHEIILPLADNDGDTQSHDLANLSPALDASSAFLCENLALEVDQRSKPRNDNRCDIGSVEVDQSICHVIKAINGNVISFCL